MYEKTKNKIGQILFDKYKILSFNNDKVILLCLSCNKTFERTRSCLYNKKSKIKCPFEVHRKQPMKHNYITYKNETHTITEWSKILNISVETLRYRQKNNIDLCKGKTKITKQCSICGKTFYSKKNKTKYCSRECVYEALRTTMKTGVCKMCGKEFSYFASSCKGVYCSRKCSTDAIREKRTEQIRISANIKANHRSKMVLYNDLQNIIEQLRKRYKLLGNARECKECGRTFMNSNLRVKYCSCACRNKNANRRKDKRLYKNGKPDMSITLIKLYMRDGGICQICGKHIYFDCDSNSKYYPSIDHIKPIAKGGTHTWDNVQLACRKCNTIKSDSF